MNIHNIKWLPLLFFIVTTNIFSFEIEIPPLTSPVMDHGSLLSQQQKVKLESQISAIFKNGGPQIQILTVKNLQGHEIEDFSIRVAEKWKIGDKKKGNGIIIIVSKEDRKTRIEVGDGIEGELTDYKSSKIIQNHMIPQFKQTNYEAGLQAAIYEIAKIFKIDVNLVGIKKVKKVPSKNKNFDLFSIGLVILLPISFFLEFSVKKFSKRYPIIFVISFIVFLIISSSIVISLVLSAIFPFLFSLYILMSKNSSRFRNSGDFSQDNTFDSNSWSGDGGGFSGGGSSGSW